jgi:hypothetical protein
MKVRDYLGLPCLYGRTILKNLKQIYFEFVDLTEDGKIILKWILKKWDGEAWTGFFWLRIGTGGGLL